MSLDPEEFNKLFRSPREIEEDGEVKKKKKKTKGKSKKKKAASWEEEGGIINKKAKNLLSIHSTNSYTFLFRIVWLSLIKEQKVNNMF